MRAMRTLGCDAAGINEAARVLRDDGLVAFPTETVYGLGADARSETAVAAVYKAKERPARNPLIIHVPGLQEAERLAVFTPEARALAEKFWPGPLTLVLPVRSGVDLAAEVRAGLSRVALRAPAHEVTQALLAAFDGPLAGPSANRSGHVSPTTASHVAADLTGRIDLLLDGGPCPLGIESTILTFDKGALVLLRQGAIPEGVIRVALGHPVSVDVSESIRAPGALPSHYAPAATLRLFASASRPGEAWLGFGPDPETARRDAVACANLSPERDPDEAARRLYDCLRILDDALGGQGCIAVAPVPEDGVGRAINDRLRRAAAPRPATKEVA